VFLAGDAAHVHSAVGIDLGIEDGTILARKMVEGGLESYAAERHPVGARVIRQTRALTPFVTVRQPFARLLRDQMLTQVIDRSDRCSGLSPAGSWAPPEEPMALRGGMAACGRLSYTPARKCRKADRGETC